MAYVTHPILSPGGLCEGMALAPEEHRYLPMVLKCTDYAQQWIRDRLTMENEMRAEGQRTGIASQFLLWFRQAQLALMSSLLGNEILLRRWRYGTTELKIRQDEFEPAIVLNPAHHLFEAKAQEIMSISLITTMQITARTWNSCKKHCGPTAKS